MEFHSRPRVAPGIPSTPSTPEPTVSGRAQSRLGELIMAMLRDSSGPRTARQLCEEAQRRGYQPTSREIIERRQQRLKASGELADRRRRQNLRWLWALVEDQLGQALRTHPAVQTIRDDLERGVLAGTIPAEAAARRILEAFGIWPGSS